jgi:hypothetical protein
MLRDIRDQRDSSSAGERLARFTRWQGEVAARFTTGSTGNLSEVIPPMLLDTLIVPAASSPLLAAATRVPLPADMAATPFTLPGVVDASGAATKGTEGENPDDATLTFSGNRTVAPATVIGRFPLTRELMDAASPAADMVALAAARADYDREVEARLYAELNGSDGQGGSIGGSGFVPSGARVRTAADAAALGTGLRAAVAEYPHDAGVPAAAVALSRDASVAAGPLLDSWATNPVTQGVTVGGSQAMVDGAAGDGDALVLGPGALWVWESPLLKVNYFERSGPAVVEVVVFGYVAVRLIRPAGLSAIRYTG